MLANAPNGQVADALAKIYTKEGITLSKPKGGGKGDGKPGEGADGAGAQDEELFTPVVYVAKVSKQSRLCCCCCCC